jgi:hypothetical protein
LFHDWGSWRLPQFNLFHVTLWSLVPPIFLQRTYCSSL